MVTLNTGKDILDFSVLKLTETELKLGLGEFLMKKNLALPIALFHFEVIFLEVIYYMPTVFIR